jgi:mannosyltransferase
VVFELAGTAPLSIDVGGDRRSDALQVEQGLQVGVLDDLGRIDDDLDWSAGAPRSWRPGDGSRRSWRRRTPAGQGEPRLWLTCVSVGLISGVALVLRLPGLGDSYWVDEAISVGIAAHPVSQIPSLLRLDGSPPLYYFLLHFWMRLFGQSETATHVLSLVPSIATVPVTWWAARSLFGRRAAYFAALLSAVSAFLIGNATETRMYSLAALLGLLVAICFVRSLVEGRRIWLVGLILASSLMTWVVTWGPFVLAGIALTGLAFAAYERSRTKAFDTALCCFAVTVLYLPWLPSLVFQIHHTGAPWAAGTDLAEMIADVGGALGGAVAVVTIALMLLGIWKGRKASLPIERYEARIALGLGGLVLVPLLVAGVLDQFIPLWDERYLVIVIGPMLILFGAALSRSRPGRVAAVIASAVMLVPVLYSFSFGATARHDSKSNVAQIASEVSSQLKPGDLVISGQIDQVPVLNHYLPAGLTYATPLGLVTNPFQVDWRDLQGRLEVAQPAKTLLPLIDALPAGTKVLMVDPWGWSAKTSPNAYSELLLSQEQTVNRLVLGDYSQLGIVSSKYGLPQKLDIWYPFHFTVPSRPGMPVVAILLVKK